MRTLILIAFLAFVPCVSAQQMTPEQEALRQATVGKFLADLDAAMNKNVTRERRVTRPTDWAKIDPAHALWREYYKIYIPPAPRYPRPRYSFLDPFYPVYPYRFNNFCRH